MSSSKAVVLALLYFSACLCADPDISGCEVAARTEQGFACGRIRKATNGDNYASFRGIPYAKQPLGELRFKELQPAEPFEGGVFNATEAGPICAQVDIFYQPNGLASPISSGEDCIRINVHIREEHLPDPTASTNDKPLQAVLFWIHGGSFSYGSGDADFHGPEYLMTKHVVLVTINYRLHAFGFLSLDNKYIPGNNGLRDVITALKWVQRNIRNFGGDPDRVTVAGQSAGGVLAHMLSISPAANGLFKQVYGSSGQAIASFYSYSQSYAKLINAIFFGVVGINPLQSAKKVHDDLVAAPLEKILAANKVILDTFGLVSFTPVVEKPQENFTTILPKEAEELLNEGAGKEYPMIIGFCSNEAEAYRKRLAEVALPLKITLISPLTLPQNLLFSAKPLLLPVITAKQLAEYYNGTNIVTLDKLVVSIADSYYKYPGQRLTQKRLRAGAAKTYLYQFGYPGERNPLKVSQNVTYSGAGHVEDITYFFRLNTFLGPQTEANELAHTSEDNKMKDFMTNFITNFVINGSPADSNSDWPPTQSDLKFQNIEVPLMYNFTLPTPYMEDKLTHFSNLYATGGLGAQ